MIKLKLTGVAGTPMILASTTFTIYPDKVDGSKVYCGGQCHHVRETLEQLNTMIDGQLNPVKRHPSPY